MAYKKALIVGSNGMLGQAFVRQLKASNIEPIGIARSNANYCLDLINMEDLDKIIKESGSDFVINCAAIVSLKDCEDYPLMAKKINADLVNYLAKSCLNNSKKFIHISTDHYYLNDKKILHNENDDIKIVNQYAKTKRMGELNALKFEESLIVRTNITGFRGIKSKPTFFEWLYDSLIKKSEISLFSDFYASTISASLLAKYVIISLNSNLKGVVNIASSECVSKKEFALLLAKKLSINFDWYKDSSVKNLKPKRADSLGLDCTKIENLLRVKMPSTNEVVNDLLKSLKN